MFELFSRVISKAICAIIGEIRAYMEHGDAWLQKVRRLRQFKHAPEMIIFPVKILRVQNGQSKERGEVANYLIDDLKREGIDVVLHDDTELLENMVKVKSLEAEGLLA